MVQGAGGRDPGDDPIREVELVEIYARGLRSTPESAALVSFGGRLVDVNQAWLRALGYTREDVLARTTGELDLWVDQQTRARLFEELQRSGSVVGEAQLRGKDGRAHDFYLAATLVPAGERTYVFWLGRDVTGQTRSDADLAALRQALREANMERNRLVARLVHAAEQERARISADVHDGVLQQLTASQLRLSTIGNRLGAEQRAELERVEESMSAAIDGLRSLMWELRPPELEREGLGSAVRSALTEIGRSAGFAPDLDDRLMTEPSAESAALAYRLIYQALDNVRKHASASHVKVILEERDQELSVVVSDDGVGFDVEDRQERPEIGHIGLQVIQDLVRFSGGSLQLTSSPGQGTTVAFHVPMTLIEDPGD